MANLSYDSNGKSYTQSQIRSMLAMERKWWVEKYVCECCEKKQANDPDHTIAQARSKILHKVELIWLEGNVSWSCRECHLSWESYRDGRFSHHKNAYKRMMVVGMYDPENFKKRFQCITNEELRNRLQRLYDTIDE